MKDEEAIKSRLCELIKDSSDEDEMVMFALRELVWVLE
jgi:hypothetical protein